MRWVVALIVASLPLLMGDGADASETGSISGTVFADADSDGVLDPEEVTLGGLQVSIYGENEGCPDFCDSLITDADGTFHTELPAASYHAGVLRGYMCIDPLRTNWLGVYIQGFCTNGGVDVPVTVEAGEENPVMIPVSGLEGHLGGRLWLDGVPAPAGTTIEARSGSTVCATAETTRNQIGGVVVSEFDLAFGRDCSDGPISLFAGDREFAQTTWDDVWEGALMSWQFSSTYFSSHEYASPSFRPFFAQLGDTSGPTSVRAIIGGVLCGAASGTSSVYGLVILPDEARAGCGVLNSEISFCLGGKLASPVAYWHTNEDYFPPTLTKTDSACPVAVVMGDGNCDGIVNTADITDTLRAIVDARRPACAGEANTDCDFALQARDVIPALGHLAGAPFPPAENCPAVGQPVT